MKVSAPAVKNVSILGSTGSIGTSTLAVIEHLKPRFRVAGLSAGRNVAGLAEQAQRFEPELVSVEKREQAEEFRRLYKGPTLRVVHGPEGAEEVARLASNDIVVSAITGIKGLRPTLAAVESGCRVALANKESMVVAGRLIRDKARLSGAEIIPVDSEHSGVLQCLAGVKTADVRRVILTASGGPFLHTPLKDIPGKTVDEELRHPRWKMGRKVTIDSATLMNKGLELIEARWLFDLEPARLDVLIHPQSIVHSLVEMRDGSYLAQLGPTDMKLPIQYSLTYPDREPSTLPSLDLARVQTLEFHPVEAARFPLLTLARRALDEEGSLAAVLNAANEAAVEAFLARRISLTDITRAVARALDGHSPTRLESLEDILRVDAETRIQTEKFIERGC
jgi:1-deoxy-D-xylulose-5-phosphate reductoisomerase